MGLKNANVFLERGCPRAELSQLASKNTIFLIDGALVKSRRDRLGLFKSDQSDVRLIRELAKESRELFSELSNRDREDLAEQMAYAYYCRLSTLGASLKNRQKAFLREFGHELPELTSLLASLEGVKKQSSNCFEPFADRAKALGIRGAGPRLLGGILITAKPSRFRSMSAYLAYSGLKGGSVLSGKYNRHLRGLYHQLGTSVVMHKDPAFYGLYTRIKHDLKLRFPDETPARIEGRVRNRLSTFLAKRVYHSFRGP